MKKSITIECPDCRGTGLYSGFMEVRGEAVICVRCSGTGAKEIHYEEFTGRRKKTGISRIRAGSGTLLDDSRKTAWMSYGEFECLVPAAEFKRQS